MADLTRHAKVRMQQRGISTVALESLLRYGAEAHDHHGGTIVYFDKQARGRLLKGSGRKRYGQMEKKLNTYAVISPQGAIVTVGHRQRRIRRP